MPLISSQQEETLKLQVGSVIVAPGFSTFDPSGLDTYQYGTYQNVITSLEMERILSATGPFQGHLVRPSDGREPKKIAWLQCIGSRDINKCGNQLLFLRLLHVCGQRGGHCQRTRQIGELDTAIFFMDMRTYGKEFESYYERAQKRTGVRFVRTRIHSIVEDRETKTSLSALCR